MIMVKGFVTIFGRADALSSDFDYNEAFKCAKSLAKKGVTIVNGGYGGIMKAASKGAYEVNGKSIGVVFLDSKKRKPNIYLSKVIYAKSLFERQKILLSLADAFVAFEPKVGTLSEVTLLLALKKSGEKLTAPLCLVGEKWVKIMNFFKKERIISENLLKYVFVFRNSYEASKTITNFFVEKEDVCEKKRKEHCC